MKKLTVSVLALAMALSLAACGGGSASSSEAASSEAASSEAVSSEAASSEAASSEAASSEAASTEATSTEATESTAEVSVMSYADYAAAEVDSPVCVETYVQAKQSWWEDKATLYTQSPDGAYFIYDMAVSQEDYDKMVPGTKLLVTGYKAEWEGEVEIIDATYEILEGDTFVAEATDVTDQLGTDTLVDFQNQFVSFKGMTVEAANDAGDAFLYKWDGSGSDGDDLYFNVSKDGQTYTFTVESYLCDNTTDVYNAVKALKVGDVVDMEGFLYWYQGANPHITSVTAAQ